MKKRLFSAGLKAVAAVLLACALAACAQSAGDSDGGTVSGTGSSAAAGSRRVSISVAGNGGFRGETAKTILPVASTALGDYEKIVLTGCSAKGTLVGGSSAGIDLKGQFDAATGRAEVDLDATYWELTLTAYKGGLACLRGVRAVDLTNGTADVEFTLRPGNIDNGNGTVNISGSFTSSASDIASAAKYKVGLYERNQATLTPVSGYEVTESVSTPDSFNFALDKSSSYACPPGEYLFIFQLLTASDTVITQYTDLIIIDSGICTERTGLLIEDEDGVAAPKDFTAWLVNGSQSGSTYQVTFTWDPSDSWNATNFVLQLTEVDEAGVAVSGKTQTFPAQFAGSGESSDATYVSGSLLAGADSFTVRLPANHLYEATIKARSARGRESSAAVRTAASGTKTGCTGFGAEYINQLLRIYNLNGGSYTDGAGTAHTGSFSDWNTYTGADIALLSTTSVNKTVGTNTYACTGWKDSAGSLVTATPSGFTGGSYTAVYPSNSVSATIVNPVDLDASEVTLTGGTAQGADKYKIATNETVGIAVTDSASPTRFTGYKVLISHHNNAALALLQYEANGTGSFTYTIPAGTFAPGNYDVFVVGIGTDGHDYSYKFEVSVHAAGHP